jgi:2-polyprenyl-6-methoxyphenol hydroxylase-like FAD-dependent oxidoreductase
LSSVDDKVEVLVAGAGPVGLLCALALASRGVSVRIVDPHQRAALHSYALALHSRTLRVLDAYGLASQLLDVGQVVRRIAVHRGRERVATLELSATGKDFPFVLVVPQTVLEALVERRLQELGTSVERGRQLLAFDSDAEGVSALVVSAEPTVTTATVRAAFLVGADGGDSTVRRLLRLDFLPMGRARTYRLFEFQSPLEAPDEMHLMFDERATDVLWPLGPERGRFSFEIDEGALADEGLAHTVQTVRERAPWFTGRIDATHWDAALCFAPRLAERFGRGRVWLAGDAAHYTLPVGVQSMNVGLREAHDLARRLAAILRGESSLDLLRYYNEERTREWKMLLGLKNRLHAGPRTPAWARELGQRLVAALPGAGQDLNALLRQVGLRLSWLRRGSPSGSPSSAPNDAARPEQGPVT